MQDFVESERFASAKLAALKQGKRLCDAEAIAYNAQASVNIEVIDQGRFGTQRFVLVSVSVRSP